MKTRIIYTQIHFEDDWFNLLPNEYKYPFIYLFTNSHIGLTGIYRLTSRVALLETHLDKDIWENACKLFDNYGKVKFYREWIYVINANKYANYAGKKNYDAAVKELNNIPKDVVKFFGYTIRDLDTLSPEMKTPDTPINHKSETINKKSYTKDHKSDDITEEDMEIIEKETARK